MFNECHPELDSGLKSGIYSILTDSLRACSPNDSLCCEDENHSLPPCSPAPGGHLFQSALISGSWANSEDEPIQGHWDQICPAHTCCPVSSSSGEVEHGAEMSSPRRGSWHGGQHMEEQWESTGVITVQR